MTKVLRVQQQAIDAGFTWRSADESLEKVQEELNELKHAVKAQDPNSIKEEYGDLLLAMTNLSLHLNLNVIDSLQNALDKFNRRYQFMLNELQQTSQLLSALSLEEKQILWQHAKNNVG